MNAPIKNFGVSFYAVIFSVLTLTPGICFGHKEKVHECITQSAFDSSHNLVIFLTENSVPQKLTASKEWLSKGAYDEDDATLTRCFDHFYTVRPQRMPGQVDGLTDWSRPLIVAELAPVISSFSGSTVNSFAWGTQSGIWGPDAWYYNVYKWSDARTNELAALTNAAPAARETSMANMFFSLGHVLHLNQDLTSPDHVRDAAHPWAAWFEKYAVREDSPRTPNYRKYTNWFALPQNATVGWANWQAQGFSQLLDFWDRNKYNASGSGGLNNDGQLGEKLGLAEFCNGNFLGETALYKECYGSWTIHYFPFPSLMHSTTFADNSTIEGLLASGLRYTTLANGEIVRPIFINKKADGITFSNHSVVSYLTAAMVQSGLSPRAAASVIPQVSVSIKNNDVLQAYQSILLPKAVEYSAGILDYFFRGTFTFRVSGDNSESDFTLKNTSGQDFSGGAFFLLLETNGVRTFVHQYPLGILPSGGSTNLTYAGAITNKYLLFYQGTIGITNGTNALDPVDAGISIAIPLPAPITVTANPLWTDSGLMVTNGQTMMISASGTWSWAEWCDADGKDDGSTDVFLDGANHGSLIAYVGTYPPYDDDTGANRWGDDTYFPRSAGNGYWLVGKNAIITTDRTGELWFLINDDAVSEAIDDNSGSLDVTVLIH